MTTTVYIDSDPFSLGDNATEADMDRYARNLEAHLEKRFPGHDIRVEKRLGTLRSLLAPCPTDDAVSEYVRDLHAGNGWLALLSDEDDS